MKSIRVQFMLGGSLGSAGLGNGGEVTVKMRTWNGARHKT